MTGVPGRFRRRFRSAVSGATAAAMLLAQVPVAGAADAMTRAEYEACQARDEQGFRAAIDDITFKGLRAGIAGIDYRSVVAQEWKRIGLDEVIDKQVDRAVDEVRDESSWTQLLQSLTSKDKAQELATTVTERVYKSDALKVALESLATGVGKAVAKRIETATIDTAEPAMQCMQAFLGPRYGTTVARAVSRDAGKEYAVDPGKGGAQVSTGQVLSEHGDALAGAVVLLVRRQLANMAARIGQRIVGAVLSRLVSVVAGGVGLVLIAKDIWELRNGALPIIAAEMKAKSTKDKVQEELAKTIGEQISDNLREISAKTADRVVEIWTEFRRAHAKVLELAEAHEPFKRFLDLVKPESLPRLDEVVAIVLGAEGTVGVMKRLEDGTLNVAVNQLPPAAIDIARQSRSLEVALRWVDIAGDDLGKVVEYEIYQRAKPDTFTRASLQRLLQVGDRIAVARLAALKPESRERLYEIDDAELKSVARALTESELDGLAAYLTGLEKQAGQRVLRAVAQSPARMQMLARSGVREAVLASRDQSAAVAMMLRSDTVPDPTVVLEHARLVYDGRVSPGLMWEKHPVSVVSAFALVAIVLLWLWRLVFGRRPRVIVQQAASSNRRGRS